MPINRVGAAGIQDCTVVGADVQDATVTGDKFQDGSIANSQLANSSVTLGASSVSLGGSVTLKEDVQWQAVQVADGSTQVVASSGNGYFLDTNSGVIEVILPSSPTRGDVVVLVDYAGTFATNRCIVNTGGVNIDSTLNEGLFQLTTNNTIAYFVYVDSAKGWMVYLNQAAGTTPSGVMNAFGGYDTLPSTYPYIGATGGTVTTDGDYKIHTFTGDGCFVVTYNGLGTACAPSNVDYLVVAGGGSGRGGGGGAGGYRTTYPTPGGGFPISTTTYSITVGASTPQNGSDSIFSTITSTGGGRGGLFTGGYGNPGGSGGGGSEGPGPSSGGTGNTPPVSPPQGNPGGDGAPPYRSGGGGGANAAGGTSPSYPIAGNGGAGKCNAITGTSLRYADGGGGTNQNDANQPGAGGLAGGPTGGRGAYSGQSGGQNAPENRGGGGGGAWCSPPGLGGKGIVIIRYKYQ